MQPRRPRSFGGQRSSRPRALFPMPGRGERLGTAWWAVIAVLYLPARALVRTRYRNIELLAQRGPVIVVTNHVSHVDPILVARMMLDLGRRPRFLAKEGIFAVPVVGAAMRGMGHVPVKRGSVEARRAFASALEMLEHGGLIVMHPEGTVTRDPDGWPMAGKTGAARLALMAPDVPVVPLAQWGVQNSIDLYRRRVKLVPRPVHIMSLGEPIDLSDLHGRPVDGRLLAQATERIVRRLRSDVAALRELPSPDGELYVWKRPEAS